MTLFDRYIAVDWSGRGDRTRRDGGPDAIWYQSFGRNGAEIRDYARSRAEAVALLLDELRRRADRRERILIGFDFSFGWPAGFAEHVTGAADWRALWTLLETEIEDSDTNAHNVYAWAEKTNAAFSHDGPFWNHVPPNGARVAKPESLGALAELRLCEVAMKEKRGLNPMSAWKLSGVGVVGVQSLLGVRAISKLRRLLPNSRIWPFETGWRTPEPKPGEIIFAELYFALLGDGDTGEISPPKDARQVRGGAGWLAVWDEQGELARRFACSNESIRDIVEREEGWTLGA